MKVCSNCKKEKSEEFFASDGRRRGGLRLSCKECDYKSTKTCQDCKTEKPFSEFAKCAAGRGGIQQRCKICDRLRIKKWQGDNLVKIRSSHLKRKYGLTYPEYQVMLERQQSKCAICNRIFELTGRKKTWKTPCVDHCHVTGKVRSLLCHSCNCLLGNCLEDPQILLRAIQYLSEQLTKNNN